MSWKIGSPYGLDKVEILEEMGSHLVATVIVKRGFVSHATGRQIYEEEPGRMRRARLIAAAPDLLDALQGLLKVTFDSHNNDPAYWAAQRAVFKVEGKP